MSIKQWFLGTPVKETLEATTGLSDSIFKGLDEVFTSPEEKAMWATKKLEIESRLAEIVNSNVQALNLINAGDERFFHSAWRPAIGWVLAISIAFYFIPRFFMATIMWVQHSWGADKIVDYPVDDSGLWQLATMMLGHAALRTYEKKSDIAKH